MKLNLYCRRFRRLAVEVRDRELDDREHKFLIAHRGACDPCRRHEQSLAGAFDGLMSIVLVDAEPSHNYEERLLRRLKVSRGRDTWRYWSPALIGACVASVALLAAMQLVAQSTSLPLYHPAGQTAKVIRSNREDLPLLLLETPDLPSEATTSEFDRGLEP